MRRTLLVCFLLLATVATKRYFEGPAPQLSLFDINNKGHFTLSEHARQEISTFAGPIYIIVLAGDSRKGKSLTCNEICSSLSGSPGGFPECDSTDPCTPGINYVAIQLKEGGTLLVVDTEGTNNGDITFHSKFMALNFVTGVTFVYVDTLFNFQTLKNVNAFSVEAKDLRSPSPPSCVILLNLFSLELKWKGKPVAPQEYIDYYLEDDPSESAEARSLKKSIKKECDGVSLFTFPNKTSSPVDYERSLKDLTSHLVKNAKPLKNGNAILSGAETVSVLDRLATLTNEKELTKFDPCWIPSTRLASVLEKEFSPNSLFPLENVDGRSSNEDLKAKATEIFSSAQGNFSQKASIYGECAKPSEEKLKRECEQHLETLLSRNLNMNLVKETKSEDRDIPCGNLESRVVGTATSDYIVVSTTKTVCKMVQLYCTSTRICDIKYNGDKICGEFKEVAKYEKEVGSCDSRSWSFNLGKAIATVGAII